MKKDDIPYVNTHIIDPVVLFNYVRKILEIQSEMEDDILKTVAENCKTRSRCKGCKYFDTDTIRCRLVGTPNQWEVRI